MPNHHTYMKKTFSDAEFWDFVDGIGKVYKYWERLGSEGVATGLRVAEQISGNEREEFKNRLLAYLKDTATRNGPSMDEIERVCGACLILGCWRAHEAVPTISRFLKSRYAMPPLAAIDSLDMLTRNSS